MNWCVVIPTYNNEKTLEKVIRDVLAVTGHVIVVNDGSTDSTSGILEKFPAIQVISYSPNRGKGYALRKGFELAADSDFQYAITLDSDGQHHASDIGLLLDAIKESPDSLIVGQRTLPAEKLRRGSGFANRLSNFWFRLVTGIRVPDTQSGFRLYPLQLFQDIRFYTARYEFELEVLVRSAWKGIPVVSVPISVFYPEPSERVSHYRPFRDFLRISLLNTVFVIIALFFVKPFSFLKYMKKERIREFINRNIIHNKDSNSRITFSVMLGVFMGIVPIWGYQLITAIALAYLFRLNKFIVIVAANISIPPMIPFILYFSYLAGGWILPDGNSIVFTTDFNVSIVRDNLFQYIVGSIALAVSTALCFGLVTILLLRVFRNRKNIQTR